MRALHRNPSFRTLLGLGLGALALPVAGQAGIEQTVVGPRLDKDSGYVVSPRGQRLACAVGTPDGRGAIVVDGKQEQEFDGLLATDFVEVSFGTDLSWTALRAERRARSEKTRGAVRFSDDGTRYAYAVVRGEATVVVVDGRDLWSAPTASGEVSGLDFSPHSLHAYHIRHPRPGDQGDGFQLVIDGLAERLSYFQPLPVFSPDGTHYAYVATDLDRTTHHLIVDGQEADYLGLQPTWTAGNQLLTVTPLDRATSLVALQRDGRRWFEAPVVERLIPAPVGDRVAVLTRSDKACRLYVDGEEVGSAAAIEDVIWSADGKRYGAVCKSARGTRFLLLDGQPGPEYGDIKGVTFSPDSARVHFGGLQNGQHVLVLDNARQSPPSSQPIEPLVRADGSLAYVLSENLHKMTLVLGGEQLGPMRQLEDLTLGAAGTRYAAAFGAPNDGSVLIDGMVFDDVQTKPFVSIGLDVQTTERFVFSPDAEHLLYLGWFKHDTRAMGVFVDDALIPTPSTNVSRPQFTPDGKHVLWIERAKPYSQIVVDGRVEARFDLGSSSLWERHPDSAAMGPDGVFTILGPVGDSIVRLRITPDPNAGVGAMVAAALGK